MKISSEGRGLLASPLELALRKMFLVPRNGAKDLPLLLILIGSAMPNLSAPRALTIVAGGPRAVEDHADLAVLEGGVQLAAVGVGDHVGGALGLLA